MSHFGLARKAGHIFVPAFAVASTAATVNEAARAERNLRSKVGKANKQAAKTKEVLQTSSSTDASAEPKRVYCQECGRQFAQEFLEDVGINTFTLIDWANFDRCYLPSCWHAQDLPVGGRLKPPWGQEMSRFRGKVRHRESGL